MEGYYEVLRDGRRVATCDDLLVACDIMRHDCLCRAATGLEYDEKRGDAGEKSCYVAKIGRKKVRYLIRETDPAHRS